MKAYQQIIVFVIVTLAAAVLFSGCAGGTGQWEQVRDTLQRELAATTRQLPALERELEALPPGPARQRALEALAQAQALVPRLAEKIDAVDRIILAGRGGDAGAVGAGIGGLLAGVPVIGPYAGLIGLLAGMGWGIYQRLRRANEVDEAAAAAAELRQHLANVVRSLETAGPDWTEADKAAIRAIQGEATTRVVEEIKKQEGG
jgi:hypothetical protein